MDLPARDALVVTKLSAVAPLTGPQAVNECIRILGADFAAIVRGYVGLELFNDVAGLQTAVADLADPAVRASSTAQLASYHGPASSGKRVVTTPKPASVSSSDHFRMRVVASGN